MGKTNLAGAAGASLSFREKYWYIFPAKVFRFFAREREESRLYRAALSPLERREMKRERRRLLLSFCASFALHSVFLLAVLSNYFIEAVFLGEKEISARDEADFNLMEGMVSSYLNPVYDESSEFIIKPSSLIKKKDSRLLSLENLLEQLRAGGGASLDGKAFAASKEGGKRSRIGQEELNLKAGLRRKKIKRKAPLSRIQLWDRVKMAQSGASPAPVNYSEIMKVIDKHNFQFQECYELALLRDEKLSGKIIFLLKLESAAVKKTNLKLEGQGSASSRRALLQCLYQESKKLAFPKNREKISIKFSLIFGV